MLSDVERKSLLDHCTKFIDSGDNGVTLAHLLDHLSTTIVDKNSSEWKDWSSYMDHLNEAWVSIHKEHEAVAWPEVMSNLCNIHVVTDGIIASFKRV